MAVSIQIIRDYNSFGKCIHISNSLIESYVTVDVGPRIIHFSAQGCENLFFTDTERKLCSKGPLMEKYFGPNAEYYFYGGHRMWTSPQHNIMTSVPDNDPVEYKIEDSQVTLKGLPQKISGLQPIMELTMSEDKPELAVKCTYINVSDTTKKFSVWQLSQMAPGGLEIFPLTSFEKPPMNFDSYEMPNRNLCYFTFSDMCDKRLFIDNTLVTLKQDPEMPRPFKLATANTQGWSIYINKGFVFKVSYTHLDGEPYPDGGSSFATFTAANFLEIETMGTYKDILPGESSSSIEYFSVKPVALPIPDPQDRESVMEFAKKHM